MPDPAFLDVIRKEMTRPQPLRLRDPWNKNPGHLPPGDTEWGDNSGLQSLAHVSLTGETRPQTTLTEEEVQRLAFKAATDVGIDPWLFLAQIKTENEDWATHKTNKRSGAEGIAQVDPWKEEYDSTQAIIHSGGTPEAWHPKTLLDLTNQLKLTNPKTGKTLWTQEQSEELQKMDAYGNTGFVTNPELALAYAAKWMWAMQTQNRQDILIARQAAAKKDTPDYLINPTTAFDWTHDATRQRTEAERDSFIRAATDYGYGADYAEKIERRAAKLRRELYETIYGPAFGGEDTGIEGGEPSLKAGDYKSGRAIRARTGDTLSDIVARLGIPEADQKSYITAIQAVNNLPDIHSIGAGQLLWLPMQSQIPSG